MKTYDLRNQFIIPDIPDKQIEVRHCRCLFPGGIHTLPVALRQGAYRGNQLHELSYGIIQDPPEFFPLHLPNLSKIKLLTEMKIIHGQRYKKIFPYLFKTVKGKEKLKFLLSVEDKIKGSLLCQELRLMVIERSLSGKAEALPSVLYNLYAETVQGRDLSIGKPWQLRRDNRIVLFSEQGFVNPLVHFRRGFSCKSEGQDFINKSLFIFSQPDEPSGEH